MKYVSDDGLEWETAQDAKDADALYQKVCERIERFKAMCREDVAAIEREFPHVSITAFN